LKYFLILDVGTTNIKAHAFTNDGKLVESFEQKSKPIYPEPGWIEQEPMFIINTIHKLIEKTIAKLGKPLGFALTNQRSTTILWDKKSGEPLYNMITWQDTRTIDIIENLSKKFILKFGRGLGKTTKKLSRLIPSIKNTKKGAYIITLANIGFGTAHSSMHIRWMMENVEDIKKTINMKQAAFGNIDSWISWNLIGKHVTDLTNASATGIFDPFYTKWSKNVLKIVEIPQEIMPGFITNDTQIGMAKDYNIPYLTQIADQQASLYMAGIKKGELSITNGTGAFIDMNVGETPAPGDIGIYPLVALSTKNKTIFLLEGAVNATGSAIDWLIDIGIIKNYSEITKAFKDSPEETNITFIPPLSGLNSPYLRPDIKAAIFDITRDTSKNDFVKSLIQGIAMRCSEVVFALEKVSNINVKKVIADGGASQNDEYLQLISDFSEKQVLRPKNLNGTAYGTFMLAKSIYEKKDIIKSWIPPKVEKTFKPIKKHEKFKDQWNIYIKNLLQN
jgi:glycerol kinase